MYLALKLNFLDGFQFVNFQQTNPFSRQVQGDLDTLLMLFGRIEYQGTCIRML